MPTEDQAAHTIGTRPPARARVTNLEHVTDPTPERLTGNEVRSEPEECGQAKQEVVDLRARLLHAESAGQMLQAELRATSAEASRLLRRLAAARAQAAADASEVSRLNAHVARQERESAARIDREIRLRVAVEQTISFQLGYLLVHGLKSLPGVLSLPKNLWRLSQEAARRRTVRRQKSTNRARMGG